MAKNGAARPLLREIGWAGILDLPQFRFSSSPLAPRLVFKCISMFFYSVCMQIRMVDPLVLCSLLVGRCKYERRDRLERQGSIGDCWTWPRAGGVCLRIIQTGIPNWDFLDLNEDTAQVRGLDSI